MKSFNIDKLQDSLINHLHNEYPPKKLVEEELFILCAIGKINAQQYDMLRYFPFFDNVFCSEKSLAHAELRAKNDTAEQLEYYENRFAEIMNQKMESEQFMSNFFNGLFDQKGQNNESCEHEYIDWDNLPSFELPRPVSFSLEEFNAASTYSYDEKKLKEISIAYAVEMVSLIEEYIQGIYEPFTIGCVTADVCLADENAKNTSNYFKVISTVNFLNDAQIKYIEDCYCDWAENWADYYDEYFEDEDYDAYASKPSMNSIARKYNFSSNFFARLANEDFASSKECAEELKLLENFRTRKEVIAELK